MKNLKKFFVAISLTILLAGTVLADCAPAVPGEVNTPPCTATQEVADESSNQSATTATISSEVEMLTFDVLIAGLENLLTLY